jgi:hypothetical protein
MKWAEPEKSSPLPYKLNVVRNESTEVNSSQNLVYQRLGELVRHAPSADPRHKRGSLAAGFELSRPGPKKLGRIDMRESDDLKVNS